MHVNFIKESVENTYSNIYIYWSILLEIKAIVKAKTSEIYFHILT